MLPFRIRSCPGEKMTEVTQLLIPLDQGDRHAAAQLLPLVYDELRRLAAARLAAEPSGNTLQPTALVHEADLRLVGPPAVPTGNVAACTGRAATTYSVAGRVTGRRCSAA